MGTRWRSGQAVGAAISAGLILAAIALVLGAAAAVVTATGVNLGEACCATAAGLGWGGLTFACGWWFAARRRERVAAEVAEVLVPVVRELKHLRATLAHRGAIDEHAKTGRHPRRLAPASDDAKTLVASFEALREVVR